MTDDYEAISTGIKEDYDASGIKFIHYDAGMWSRFTEEDKQRCIKYWRDMYSTDYTRLCVIAVPDDADMIFGDANREIVYQEDMQRHDSREFARKFVAEHMKLSDKPREAIGLLGTVYTERNILVRVLATLFKGGIVKEPGSEWLICTIDIPGVGQCGWHFHESQLPLFADLPNYHKEYNGHTTEDKYERLITYARSRSQS